MARHLEDRHSSEREVVAAISLKKGSKERSKALEKIRHKGNFHHNGKVLATKKGQLIVCKRPTDRDEDTSEADDYTPCPHCFGFHKKKDLYRHVKTCIFKNEKKKSVGDANEEEEVKTNILAASSMLILPFTCPKASELLQKSVISKMKQDDISFRAKQDDLIMMFGSAIIEKNGERNAAYVSQRMRQLSRLLIQINKKVDGDLKEFLNPAKFDIVIEAVRDVCSFYREEDRNKVAIPSLALKLGHNLRKCAQIYRGVGLREKDEQVTSDTKNFLELMDYEWSDRVSSSSLSTMEQAKHNKEEMIPLTSDLEILRKSMEKKLKKLKEELKHQAQPDTWYELAAVTAARVIIFNKRRSGEASRLLLSSYQRRVDWQTGGCDAIKSTLSPLERHLCKRYLL
jgi:hypothetical protein